jgi:hypothetical protein
MSLIQPALDPTHTQPWLAPLGKLVLNFSAIELQTYLWLADLSSQGRVPDKYLYAPFKTRVKTITNLLANHTIDDTLKSECLSAWGDALAIAQQRNAILHNPIIYGWRTADESGPPDMICIPDVAHLGSKPSVTKQVVTLSDLNGLVNSTANLAARLFALRSQVQGV